MHLKDETVRVCPQCGSAHIRAAKNCGGGWLVPTSYSCEDCGYSGKICVEIDIDMVEHLQQVINTP